MNLKDLNYPMSQLSHILDCKALAVHPAMTWLTWGLSDLWQNYAILVIKSLE